MKFIVSILIIIILGYIGHLFLPFWSIAVVGGLVGAYHAKLSGIRSFFLGFLGAVLLWGIYTILVNNQNDGIIAERIARLFGDMGTIGLILITTLIGGLLGGMGALTGNLGRKLFT